MAEAIFACPKCKADFSIEPGTERLEAECPHCHSHLEAQFFPAFFQPVAIGAEASSLTEQGEASCFYHPQKQAQRVCDGCGRLICSLCSVDMGDRHLCPSCLSTGKRKGSLTTLEGSRQAWDSLALSLTVLGLFISCVSIVTAPAAIYLSIRHWNSPGSLLGVRKGKFVFAIVVSVLEILFWGAALLAAFLIPHHHSPTPTYR